MTRYPEILSLLSEPYLHNFDQNGVNNNKFTSPKIGFRENDLCE